MISRPLVLALLAAGCVTAAAGGAYVAVRQNTSSQPLPAVATAATPSTSLQPVAETEALVAAAVPEEPRSAAADPEPARKRTTARPTQDSPRRAPRTAPVEVAEPTDVPMRTPERPATRDVGPAPVAQPEPIESGAVRDTDPPVTPAEPELIEVVLPASSVIGLQVDMPISSEHAQVEDRVSARVTRDVSADGRVAIPAGSRVLGSVTLVERGGKLKERARLGIRFHTLVLANGLEVPIRTEEILREGESPSGESARKIGGAAIGGAVLGAIIGGGKGAVIGGASGAAGGTAVVMAGGRNAATLPGGTVVNVRLASPVTLDVERR